MKLTLPICLSIILCLTTQLLHAQTLVGNIIISTDSLDGTGDAMAISDDGTRIIVGTDYRPWQSIDTVGYARVYELNGNTWQPLGQDVTDENNGDEFGHTVCISSNGSRIAIGGSKGVKVYDLVGGTWQQVGSRLIVPGMDTAIYEIAFIRFSDDGNTLAISASSQISRVIVYEFSGNDWVQKGGNFSSDLRNEFGLSADGNRIVFYACCDPQTTERIVWAYEYQNSVWNMLGDTMRLPAGYRWADGIDISGDGNRVVFSLENMDNSANGAIVTYDLVGGEWVEDDSLLTVELFTSHSVSLRLSHDGNTLVFGNTFDFSVVHQTTVSVYKYIGQEWQLLGNILECSAHDESANGHVDITADGTRIVMGGVEIDTNDSRGYVKVYDYSDLIGIEEGQHSLDVQVYPNPTSDMINIKWNGAEGKMTIQLLNSNGQLINEYRTSGKSYSINLPETSGLYFINLTSENGECPAFKVLKQ